MQQAGLSTGSGFNERLQKYGANEIPEKKQSVLIKLLRWLISPIALMLIAAALLSLYDGKVFDFYFILSLVILNFAVSYIQEHRADKRSANSIRNWPRRRASCATEHGNGLSRDWSCRTTLWKSASETSSTGRRYNRGQPVSSMKPPLPANLFQGGAPNNTLYSGSYVSTGLARFTVHDRNQHSFRQDAAPSGEGDKEELSRERHPLDIQIPIPAQSGCGGADHGVLCHAACPTHRAADGQFKPVIAGIPISLPTVMTLVMSSA